MDRISLFKMSGLPDPFGVIVLIFLFILLLSPYLSGSDFGIFKIPAFAGGARKWLKIIGPVLFLLAVFFYLPIFSSTRAGLKESASANPELKPLLGQGAPSFFDGFAGGKLGSEWKVLGEDPKNWTVQSSPPSLLIVSQKGSIAEKETDLKNQFVLERELPTSFDLIVKVYYQMQGGGNSVSIALFKDDNNFIELGYIGFSISRGTHMTKEERGERNSICCHFREGGVADPSPVTFYLRIERDNNQFTGYYSFVENKPPESVDDIRWTKLGTHAWINFSGKLSLWAGNSSSSSPQSPARFDFVLIRERKA